MPRDHLTHFRAHLWRACSLPVNAIVLKLPAGHLESTHEISSLPITKFRQSKAYAGKMHENLHVLQLACTGCEQEAHGEKHSVLHGVTSFCSPHPESFGETEQSSALNKTPL